MNHRIIDRNDDHREDVTRLFTSVFTSSEGESEGNRIGILASELFSDIDNEDIICFGTYERKTLIGAIFVTRLHFKSWDNLKVYMLAPVAVSTAYQRKGVGRALINYGLDTLKKRSVATVVTYGDPAFYSKLGFQALPESVLKAPLTLSMPQGWQGQSLTARPIATIDERPKCVKAFNNPMYW